MASTVSHGKAKSWRHYGPSSGPVAGWELMFYQAHGRVDGVRLLSYEMAIGCLCEGAMLMYEMADGTASIMEAADEELGVRQANGVNVLQMGGENHRALRKTASSIVVSNAQHRG